ncbi:MAG TPA: ABC-F family ATP-binding cassette domain-containing protein [Actinomycetota bacterium]|jgi:ATPase subunit of ABC transporter with duplicated ATPase domains|nr:ABC-F family ATP-binding cassette domain-containing protein [Actinomycetota bacterium]
MGGYLEVTNLSFVLPDGRALFEDVSFGVPGGSCSALVGANGSGKTTVLRIIAGEEKAAGGFVNVGGRLGYMRQFVGSFDAGARVIDLLASLSGPEIEEAHRDLKRMEWIVGGPHGEAARMRYTDALTRWGELGGYDVEVLWDTCTTAALGIPLSEAGSRLVGTLSGGEQKRLALEVFFRSEAEVLLLDEPDNFLDIDGKQWLERELERAKKTVLFVSHDRAMLDNAAKALITIEGKTAWTHAGPFRTYGEARQARLGRIEEENRRYAEKHAKIVAQIKEFKRRAALNEKFASRARAAEKKLERYERDAAPRTRPGRQNIRMELTGGRTGKMALHIDDLSFPGLVEPFSTEILYGERVGVVGPNGTGKSHFMKLLSGHEVRHAGDYRLGARVRPAYFSQLHDRAGLPRKGSILDHLMSSGLERGEAMSRLKRYELHDSWASPFSLLSGGQQARFQILLMELESPTMLLLDEPTDNLDIDSAEALEEALVRYRGTVLVVTHDRYFMRLLDRFLIFYGDGSVHEGLVSPYGRPG